MPGIYKLVLLLTSGVVVAQLPEVNSNSSNALSAKNTVKPTGKPTKFSKNPTKHPTKLFPTINGTPSTFKPTVPFTTNNPSTQPTAITYSPSLSTTNIQNNNEISHNTTSQPTISTNQECNKNKVDLVFTYDVSQSIDSQLLQQMIEQTEKFVNTLNISPEDVRVAVIAHDMDYKILLSLNDEGSTNSTEVLKALGKVTKYARDSSHNKRLAPAYSYIKTQELPATRDRGANIIVLTFTDGKVAKEGELENAIILAREIRELNGTMTCATTKYEYARFHDIVCHDRHFPVGNQELFNKVMAQAMDDLCKIAEPTKPKKDNDDPYLLLLAAPLSLMACAACCRKRKDKKPNRSTAANKKNSNPTPVSSFLESNNSDKKPKSDTNDTSITMWGIFRPGGEGPLTSGFVPKEIITSKSNVTKLSSDFKGNAYVLINPTLHNNKKSSVAKNDTSANVRSDIRQNVEKDMLDLVINGTDPTRCCCCDKLLKSKQRNSPST